MGASNSSIDRRGRHACLAIEHRNCSLGERRLPAESAARVAHGHRRACTVNSAPAIATTLGTFELQVGTNQDVISQCRGVARVFQSVRLPTGEKTDPSVLATRNALHDWKSPSSEVLHRRVQTRTTDVNRPLSS
jgi:hypothetical protein